MSEKTRYYVSNMTKFQYPSEIGRFYLFMNLDYIYSIYLFHLFIYQFINQYINLEKTFFGSSDERLFFF